MILYARHLSTFGSMIVYLFIDSLNLVFVDSGKSYNSPLELLIWWLLQLFGFPTV